LSEGIGQPVSQSLENKFYSNLDEGISSQSELVCMGLVIPNQYCHIVVLKVVWVIFISWAMPDSYVIPSIQHVKYVLYGVLKVLGILTISFLRFSNIFASEW